jgi:hypothetical protein
MCGIAGVYINDPANPGMKPRQLEKLVNGLLTGIEHRGRHATGIVVATGKKAQLFKRDIPARQFVKLRPRLPRQSDMILLHTRFATKGDPSNPLNNHPVTCGGVFAVHNGHVSNDDELFKEFKLKRKGEVDTEIIPQLVNKFGLDKVNLALQELEGAVATAVIDPRRRPHTMVVAKGSSSPVAYWRNDHGVVFASEARVVQDAVASAFGIELPWKDVDYLGEGDLLWLQRGGFEELEFKVKPRTYSSGWTNGYGRQTSQTTTQTTTQPTPPTKPQPGAVQQADYVRDKLGTPCEDDGCGHTKFWHSGADYLGQCLKATCRCGSFLRRTAKAKATTVGATSSPPERKTFTIFDTIKNEKVTYIKCSGGCGHAKTIDEITTYGGYDFCDECWGTDGFVPGGEAVDLPTTPEQLEVMQELAEHTTTIMERVAAEHDTTVHMVQWLLFECEERILDNQEVLRDMRSMFEDSYIEIEAELEKELADAAASKGDEEASSCETDSACGVTVFEETAAQTPDAQTV